MRKINAALAILLLTLSAPALALSAKGRSGSTHLSSNGQDVCAPANSIARLLGQTPNMIFIDNCAF